MPVLCVAQTINTSPCLDSVVYQYVCMHCVVSFQNMRTLSGDGAVAPFFELFELGSFNNDLINIARQCGKRILSNGRAVSEFIISF